MHAYDHPPLTIKIHHGIQPGEVERHFQYSYDWTQEWEWAICVLFQYDSSEHRQAQGAFYFKDLPARLEQIVPWKDAEQTLWVTPGDEELQRDREDRFSATHKFCHRGELALWSAWLTVKGWDRQEVVSMDIWELMESWPIIA